jgi:hypothetical protein
MNKVDYQNLRFFVESTLADSIDDPVSVRAVCNQLMGQFVRAMADSQVKQASSKRAFKTFRRDLNVLPPSWAYRKPGIDSRLPKL